ncbi:hypothetical protein JOF41_000332 [Saccharothrix coeruleofusca]|uniref:hypothetical protein n=1 Tax=Saccharothrix coeruleofusca TaxID=33919 RepID=UPI001AE6A71E|nr:hypothetical protein [Saccharothrix coeruleofusca]MBP2334154.1 hypothetical protein [Saccharothrix coeruleofusca]
MASLRELLFRDIDGNGTTEPYAVIDAGVTDRRYLDRIPGLREVLADDAAEGYHRFLAVVALASWGHAPVYPVVAAIAEAGRRSPWFGRVTDGRDRDYSFPTLAGAVAEGRALTDDEPARLTAVRALTRRADEVFFHWQLAYAADDPALADAVAEVVDRGLARDDEPDFDRSVQLADLCAVLARHDRPRAEELAHRLLARDSRTVTRTHLCSVVPFREVTGA